MRVESTQREYIERNAEERASQLLWSVGVGNKAREL